MLRRAATLGGGKGAGKAEADASGGDAAVAAYSECIEHLAGLNPSAIDLELRSLDVSNGGAELALFVAMLQSELQTARNFELVQAYLAAFLRVHSDVIPSLPALQEPLIRLRDTERAMWLKLKGKMQKVLCLVGALSNMQ
mmetsp:Transcript_33258/g.67529  ORF Transcript_33258/g.67529 Transcript_33258/m.67529 type:complete len:140 (+) Transcript_33258:3-422(+)